MAWRRLRANGDRAAEQWLLDRHTPLVGATLGRKGTSPGTLLGWDDLHAVGLTGLLLAIRTYDPTRAAFRTHAINRIRASVQEARRLGQEEARSVLDGRRAVARATAEIEAEGGLPDDDELRARTGLSVTTYRLATQGGPTASLEALWEGEDGDTTAWQEAALVSAFWDAPDSQSRRDYGNPETVLLRSLRAEALWRAVDALPPRYACVMRHYYSHDRTLAETGREMGISDTRVEQIRGEALKRLSCVLAGHSLFTCVG